MVLKARFQNSHPFYSMIAGTAVFYIIGYSISLISSVLITRHLGPEGRGLVSSAISFSGIGGVLAQVGMAQMNKKLAAEHKELAGELFFVTIFICLGASLLVVPLIYFLIHDPKLIYENLALFFIVLALIPIFAISSSCGEILVGMHRNRAYNTLFLVEKITYAILIIIAVITNFVTPLLVLMVLCIAQVIRTGLCWYFLRDELSLQKIKKMKLPKFDKSFILVNYLVSTCFVFSYHILPILLVEFSTLSEIGYFACSRAVTDVLLIFTQVYSSYAVKKLVSERQGPNYQKTKFILVISTLAFMAIAAGTLYMIASWLIPLIFGQSFAPAILCFRHLLPTIIFYGGYQMLNSILLVERRVKSLLFPAIIFALVTFLLPFILSARIDAVTSAESYSISCFIIFMLTLFSSKALFMRQKS